MHALSSMAVLVDREFTDLIMFFRMEMPFRSPLSSPDYILLSAMAVTGGVASELVVAAPETDAGDVGAAGWAGPFISCDWHTQARTARDGGAHAESEQAHSKYTTIHEAKKRERREGQKRDGGVAKGSGSGLVSDTQKGKERARGEICLLARTPLIETAITAMQRK
ncbi:hypothetical protein WOLCODRAFT_150418 [Wolfiporia cocos MD-104 SS10]|uniref:Uncharacterized protein n=1 Tax=Wolfiporia cocos (strain MD-104) TaxID=742152 RepID=A0A2H3JER7_WOLCO|nr:hypothetical protein WOLCODRAFT_150418 [Wolfiporia cocos MD-104 SS10]